MFPWFQVNILQGRSSQMLPHPLPFNLSGKNISASPKLNILWRGKMGWGSICLWWVWGRGSQTGSEKVGKLKSLQLPASNGHASLLPWLPGLQVCVAWNKSIPDGSIPKSLFPCGAWGQNIGLCHPSWSCQYWTKKTGGKMWKQKAERN